MNQTAQINSALITFPIQNNEAAARKNPTLMETIFSVLLYFPALGDSKTVQLAKLCIRANNIRAYI